VKPCFVVVDKPEGVTSHDVVAAVRAVTGVRKVGHTGTLDPFATGVLVLALGHATRMIQFLDEREKVYDCTLKLGERTDTGDPTGEVVEQAEVPDLTAEQVQAALDAMVGESQQVPPSYSAVRVDGKRLYEYARKGETVEAKARTIHVYGTELLRLGDGEIVFRVRCSRGTYARVLAEDLAKALGTVGHLTALAREASGVFSMAQALSMAELGRWVAALPEASWFDTLFARLPKEERIPWNPRDEVREAVLRRSLSLEDAFSNYPSVRIDGLTAGKVRSGQRPKHVAQSLEVGTRFILVHGQEMVAIAERKQGGIKVLRVVPYGA